MKKKLIISILIVAALGVVLFVTRNNAGTPGVSNENTNAPESAAPQTQNANQNTVVYTDSGFSPNLLTVKRGETVTFVNEGSDTFWPASAMHPTHKVYPGSDIEKCGTAEAPKIFDACRGIQPGGSWSFTFDEIGSWNYHNHLNPKNFGKIVVE